MADTQAKTRALHEVVELDEALEHAGLLLLGNTGTGVLAIEVDTLLLLAIAHLDMTLMGVLHGIGNEVGEHLLDAALVERGGEGGIRIVLDELHAGLLYALGEGLTDVVEHLSEVARLGLDGEGLTHVGGLEDIVDEAHEHVAVVADDADEVHALLVGVDHGEEVGEAHDGIERGADFVGHIGEEGALHLTRILGALGFFLQLALGLHEVGDVTGDAEEVGEGAVALGLGDTVDGIPYGVLLHRCGVEVGHHVVRLLLGDADPDLLEGLGEVGAIDVLEELIDGFLIIALMARAADGDLIGEGIVLPDEHLTIVEQIAQLVLVRLDGGIGLLHLAFVAALLQIDLALVGHVAGGADEVAQLAILVEGGIDLHLDVLEDAEVGIEHALARMEHLPGIAGDLAFHQGDIEERQGLPIGHRGVVGDPADLPHLGVEVDGVAIGIIERHGDGVGLEHLMELTTGDAVLLLLEQVLGHILYGIDDIACVAVLLLGQGIAVEILPNGLFEGAYVEADGEFEGVGKSADEALIVLMENGGLNGFHAGEELLGGDVLIRQHRAVDIAEGIVDYIELHDTVGTHVEGLVHHAVQVDGAGDGHAYAGADELAEQEGDDAGNDDTQKEDEGDGRGVVVDTLGMEPLVADALDVARLLESGIGIVDGIYEFLIVADDAEFAGRDVDLVEHHAIDTILLELGLEGNLAPDVVLILAGAQTDEGLARGVVFGMEGQIVHLGQAQIAIVVLLEHDGIVLSDIADVVDGRRGMEAGYPHVVIGDHVLRHDIGRMLILEGEGVDEVGLAALEGLGTLVPLVHLVLVGDVQTGEYQVEHLDVIAVGVAHVVEELIGRELPVAGDDEGALLGVLPDIESPRRG